LEELGQEISGAVLSIHLGFISCWCYEDKCFVLVVVFAGKISQKSEAGRRFQSAIFWTLITHKPDRIVTFLLYRNNLKTPSCDVVGAVLRLLL
jgi:hypothetical protein